MEDEQIIELYIARSELAIIESKNKFGRFCKTIAFNILSNKSDAEECENDTYLAAWNTIPPTRPDKLSAFLGRLTRNIALSKYDYNTAQKRYGKFDLILDELEELVSDGESIEAIYDALQTSKAISNFLRKINEENRVLFVRRYWYCESIADLAKRYGISESKVKSSLYRTRKKLKHYLQGEGINI
ncbi:MAG: RNA polymerase sigma factor [Turicibacter sp.]